MRETWKATIRTWPYSTKEGAKADHEAVGAEFTVHEIEADDIRAALRGAELVVAGIRTNPRVWQSFITALEVKR